LERIAAGVEADGVDLPIFMTITPNARGTCPGLSLALREAVIGLVVASRNPARLSERLYRIYA